MTDSAHSAPFQNLSSRGQAIYLLAAKKACSISEIAKELGIAANTVSQYLTKQIYPAFGVKDLPKLVKRYDMQTIRRLRQEVAELRKRILV